MDPREMRGAIVLAGGASARMGRDKAALPFGEPGGTMLSRVVSALSSVASEIVVVARRGQALPDFLRAAGTAPVTRVDDEFEGRGPMGGLVPGLRALSAPVAFASSCDVPFLSRAFVLRIFESLGDAEAAVPESGGFLHPLGAVYRRTVLPRLEALLAADRLRLTSFLELVSFVKVPEAALLAVDPDLSSLSNVNTPEDYAAALERFSRERGSRGPPFGRDG